MRNPREDVSHQEPTKEINLTIPMIPDMEIAASRTAEAVAEEWSGRLTKAKLVVQGRRLLANRLLAITQGQE